MAKLIDTKKYSLQLNGRQLRHIIRALKSARKYYDKNATTDHCMGTPEEIDKIITTLTTVLEW